MITQSKVKGEHKTNFVSQYVLVPETDKIRESFVLAEFSSVHSIVLEDVGIKRIELKSIRKGWKVTRPEEGTKKCSVTLMKKNAQELLVAPQSYQN